MMKFNKDRSISSKNRTAKSPNEPNKVLRFVSLVPQSGIEDYEILKDIIGSRGFSIDFSEFKITNTKVQKRLINAAQKNGPRERVEIEEKVEVNSNYKYLRQVSWRVLKEINNVLLLQLPQIKGIPCTLPLIFPEIIKENRKILVTGLSYRMMVQLVARPDLKFEKIPPEIAKDNYLKQKLLERAEREKAMQAVARTMQDFSGIPEDLKEKLTDIASGNRIFLTDEEAINVILISDLYTRYFPLFQTFQNDINSRSTSVASLASQFAEMTQGIRTERLIDAFRDYLIDDDDDDSAGFASENNQQLFSYLYKKAQLIDEKRVKLRDTPLTRADMYSIMRSMITLVRSQKDPELWRQCLYFYTQDDVKTTDKDNIKTLDILIQDVHSKLKVQHSASTQSLLEIHLINNIHRFITGRKVLISKSNLPEAEIGLIQSVVIPNLYQPDNSKKSGDSVRLFLGMQDNLSQLINPIHTVSRVYGFLVGRRLRESVQKFLKPGLRELLHRFGKNFFSIFYQMAVQESGIQISRNQFAKWLELKQYFKKLEDLGYIPNELETHFDSLLTPEILQETGDSCFPNTYSEESFSEEYKASQKAFVEFLANLKTEKTGFSKLLTKFLSTGNYDLRSQEFKSFMRRNSIYKTLQDVVIQSCMTVKYNLEQLAVNNKVILKIPLEIEYLLLIESIFQLNVEEKQIQIHLIAVPVASADDLESTSKSFSKELLLLLKNSTESGVKELVLANRIIRVYQKAFIDYNRFLSIAIIDRQINSTILKIRQQKNQTPNHIKYHFENYEKLLVGNLKSLNLGKLIQIDKKQKSKEVYYNLSIAEVLQAVIFFRSASHKIRDYRSTIEQVLQLIRRVSSSTGEDYESITYVKQATKLYEMLATPVDELNENVLNLVKTLAKKIDNTVRQSFSKGGVLVKVYKLWKEQYPERANKIGFYTPFMRVDDRAPEAKLFSEIARVREILLGISRRKCMIIFPDKHQEDQLKFISEIGAFITERDFNTKMYVEIGGLNKESIEELSKVYYPGNFFRMDRLKPVKP